MHQRSSCQTLPLADFGSATFGSARAVDDRRHDRRRSPTALVARRRSARPRGRQFVAPRRASDAPASATPSALTARRHARSTVTYSPAPVNVAAVRSRAPEPRACRLVGLLVAPASLTRAAPGVSYEALSRPTRLYREPSDAVRHEHRSDTSPLLDHQPRRGIRRAGPRQPRRLARAADEHQAAARAGRPTCAPPHEVARRSRRSSRSSSTAWRCSATRSCTRRSPTSRSRSSSATRRSGPRSGSSAAGA